MLDAGPYRVLPRRIFVGVAVFVNGCIGFFYLGMGSALEVHVQVLRQIPPHRELAVPQELLGEGQGQLAVLRGFHVALLQLIVVARHLRVEAYALR